MNGVAVSYYKLGRYAEALELSQKTLALQKAELGPDHHDTLQSMHNLATSYSALGQNAKALELREKTLALRKAKLGPDHPDTLSSMWGVAVSLVKLHRGAEALPIIDECLQRATGKGVNPRLLPSVMGLRLRHFEKARDAAGCRATAEMWEKLGRTDADSLYKAACYRAVTARVLRATAKGPDADKQANAEADRAMEWLRKALTAGYDNVGRIKKDRDLRALRQRTDFKKLLADLMRVDEQDR
jgi:tetratricopeptide (TPR) repeat protein